MCFLLYGCQILGRLPVSRVICIKGFVRFWEKWDYDKEVSSYIGVYHFIFRKLDYCDIFLLFQK